MQVILSLTHRHRKLRTLSASIAVALLFNSLSIVDAAIITSGDVSPGVVGAQPDPWNVGLLAVGLNSSGTITLDNGSHMNSTVAYLAINDGSSAHFEMSGYGTSWNNPGQLTIGDGGTATAVIENGAVINIGGTVVVGNSSEDNKVEIRTASGGQRATLRVQGNLYLGGDAAGPAGGEGMIIVDAGGDLEIVGGTYVYHGSSIDPGPGSLVSAGIQLHGGKLTSTSPLSTLNLDNTGDITGSGTIDVNVYMGSNGTINGNNIGTNGMLNGDPAETLIIDATIAGSGTIQGAVLGGNVGVGDPITNLLGDPLTADRIAGSLVFHDVIVSSTTIFDFGIHGTDSTGFDQLVLTGDDHLAGVAQIAFVYGFEPDPADTFQLIDFSAGSSSTGWFSNVAAPGNWHLNQEGLLYHTPEPTSALLLLMGCLLVLNRPAARSMKRR